jgi:hypothetical protein
MQDTNDVSPHALKRFIANIAKIVQAHERGMMTDLEFYSEVKSATRQCEDTIEMHAHLADPQLRERCVAELAGLTIDQLNDLGGVPDEDWHIVPAQPDDHLRMMQALNDDNNA